MQLLMLHHISQTVGFVLFGSSVLKHSSRLPDGFSTYLEPRVGKTRGVEPLVPVMGATPGRYDRFEVYSSMSSTFLGHGVD